MKINPCPHCHSDNVEYDAGPMTTSLKGIDYQCGWIECLDCGYSVDYSAEGEEVDNLTQLVIESWNKE